MIDCTGLDLADTKEQTITGLYSKVKNAKEANKSICIYNAINGPFGKVSPIACFVHNGNTTELVMSFSVYVVVIHENDVVTVTA